MNAPPSTFEWLTFLLGGALGAMIVLGLERLLDWRKDAQAKENISKAMDLELEENLKLCATIIANVQKNDREPYTYPRLRTEWLSKYSERCIAYRNDDSIRLESFIYGAKALIEQVDNIQDALMTLHATSKALSNFTDHIASYNQAMLARTQELRAVLTALKSLRRGNKVYEDEALAYVKP